MEGSKQQSRAKGQERWRDGSWLPVGALVLGLAVAAAGAPRPSLARTHGAPDSNVSFIVRTFNHAQVAPDVLSSAEGETDSIFRSAGLDITWIDCPINGEPSDAYPACQADLAPADFVMRIISPEMAVQYSWPRMRMGYAVTNCTPDLTGCWAAVSYRRVQDLALKADVSPALVLGKTMAHELGHLLLGPSHSETGIMRAELDDGDFGSGRLPSLVFLAAQREHLRAAVVAARATLSSRR
jgi:hypothetical protein